jgi:hypothetical protein
VDRCSWEGLFISMTIFAFWFEECPYKIPMGYGLGIGRY